MSKQFKAMKFWIGDDPLLSERVQSILFGLGYGWAEIKSKKIGNLDAKAMFTYSDGVIMMDSSITNKNIFQIYTGYGEVAEFEEINIDWLRTPQKETIELNGRKYLKEDLEEALKHLKAVDE